MFSEQSRWISPLLSPFPSIHSHSFQSLLHRRLFSLVRHFDPLFSVAFTNCASFSPLFLFLDPSPPSEPGVFVAALLFVFCIFLLYLPSQALVSSPQTELHPLHPTNQLKFIPVYFYAALFHPSLLFLSVFCEIISSDRRLQPC